MYCVSVRRLAFAMLWLWPAFAAANPLNQARFGGLSGDSVYQGPFAIYWNPAALPLNIGGSHGEKGYSLGIDSQFVFRQATYDRDATLNNVPASDAAANAGHATLSAAGIIPGIAGQVG